MRQPSDRPRSGAPYEPTLLHAYWALRALCEDLTDAPSVTDRQRVTAAITTWLMGHCANCGIPLNRERRRRRAEEPWCWSCELDMLPPPPLPPTTLDDSDVPF